MQPAEDLAPRGRGRARPVGARGREHGPPLGASAPWSRLLLPSACPYERERTRGRASVDGQLRVAGQGTGLHVSPQFLAPLEIQSVIHLETGSLQVWLSWDEVMLALGEPKPSLTGPCEDKALVRAEATGEEGPCGERTPHRAGPQRSAAGAWRGTSAQGPPRDGKGRAARRRSRCPCWRTRGRDATFGRSPRKPLQLEAPHRHTVFSLPRQSRL